MIHPNAFVDDTVTIGEGTNVWQFASVIRGARIGSGCNIASGACIDGSTIGHGCIIGHNLAMGPGFLIGNAVFIGPNVTFCNDAWPRAHKLGFDVRKYEDGQYAVIVADGATVGAGAVILPGVHIGEKAMIAANAVVTRNVPANHLWKGNGDISEIVNESEKKRMRFADHG